MNIALRIVSVIICLTVHECGHALMAYILGDKTAKKHGRLTLNPIAHIDPIGLLSMVFFGFGWAKPVPIIPRNFKHHLRDTALVAFAGPLSNILFALILLVVNIIISPINSLIAITIGEFIRVLIMFNIGLAVFNLLPIPPLDGSRILMPILPEKFRYYMYKHQQFIQFGLIVLLYLGVLTIPLAFLQLELLYLLGWIAEKITFFM